MRARVKYAIATAAMLGISIGAASAGEDNDLVIDGLEITIRAPAPAHLTALDEVVSGWVFRAKETQELQLDDFDNPGFVFVDKAIDTFNTVDGAAGKSCATCHADVSEFEGLRTVLPRVTEEGELWSMENYINDCRTERMQADAWKWSSTEMTGMTALISLQSRGMPTNVAIDGPAKSYWERGKEIYYTRVGQLDMACANCHEENSGNMIRADRLSQGQTNGFPVYRLKNAKLNSIHGRFKGCMKNIRATPYAEGSEEFKALELYVSSRGTGLSIESPSVRN